MKKINIAIDGPAGAGKSTVAKLVARKLGYIYIDTGAMYRALTYKAINNHLDLHNNQQLNLLISNMNITLTPDGKVFIDNEEITNLIRTDEVTNSVSLVASHGAVRHEMLIRQQEMAQNGGTVMDGRDIGTAVLPNAEVKIFLSATVEERAKRRYEENKSKGYSANFEQLKQEIALRDKRDSEREVAPLKKANDAIEIDTTNMSIDDVVVAILKIVEERS